MLSGSLICPPRWKPSGAIAKQGGERAGCDLGSDLGEVEVHTFRVGSRRNDRRADAPIGADCAEDVDRIVAVIAHHRRTRADRGPYITERPLLSHPRFILKPDLDRCGCARAAQGCLQASTEVFLKVSCASASFFG